MEIRQLAAFDAVVESGSLSRAATIVNTSQPSVSKQIQTLEQSVGTQLFDRTGQGMRLTEAGNAILPAVRELLSFWRDWTDRLASDRFAERSSGTRIWISDFAMSLESFGDWINTLQDAVGNQTEGGIEVISNEAGGPDWGELDQGGTDFIVCPSWDTPESRDDFEFTTVFYSTPCAYSSEQVFSSSGERPRGHDISAVIIDRDHSSGYFGFLEELLGSTPPVAAAVPTVAAALTAVALGQGGFLGGSHPVELASIPVKKVPIKTKAPLEMVAVWKKDRADLGGVIDSVKQAPPENPAKNEKGKTAREDKEKASA